MSSTKYFERRLNSLNMENASWATRLQGLFTTLHSAAGNGRKDLAQLLIDGGADPNKTDKHGRTPLYCAAAKGHEDVVRLLMKAGADPNKGDKDNVIPLHIAITTLANPCYFLIKLLLDKGSDPNAMDKHGKTPLSRAMLRYPHRQYMVKILLESGANPSEKEKEELRGWDF